MDSKTVGKLVRGVIYDDVDMQSIKKNMLEEIDFLGGFDDDVILNNPATKAMMENGLTFEEIKNYYHKMDTIASLTRYDFDTGETNNLIIPKESLSVGLVNELDRVDLAKDLLKAYGNKHYEDHNKETIKPEDFCKSEEEELLKYVDRQPLFTIHVDGDTKVEDFKNILSNIIGGISDLIAKEA